MKRVLKKILPARLLFAWHRGKASLAAFLNGYPSDRMIIVGVTGTKGKSSAANFIWAGFMGAGVETALLATANIRIGKEESLNHYHMTMPSPFVIQRFLRRAFAAGCTAAVIETTSEGILQRRHKGINYDILVFTNLTPEHIRSHGSFENYRRAKQTIFRELTGGRRKYISGRSIPKAVVANMDSPEAKHFLEFPADKKLTYAVQNEKADIVGRDVREDAEGTSFAAMGEPVRLKLLGSFNASNALPAFAAGAVLGLPAREVRRGVEGLAIIPGRMEVLARSPYMVIVDYAHEKESMTALLTTAKKLAGRGRVIVLLGAEGGGRDHAKRPIMGEVVARLADYVVVSNVDPYEENPASIIRDIAESAAERGKAEGATLFSIQDRREGIRKALRLARPGDIVLITGKGAEQSMIIGRRRIPWDDRIVVREELAKMVSRERP